VARLQTGTVLGLLLESLAIKSHSDVVVVERRKKYYMGEGDGFPRVRAVMSFASPESLVTCSNTKGVPKSVLTNLLVGWMQIQMSNKKLVTFPNHMLELQHALSTLFSVVS
jgi:hypothetical protein